MSEEKTGPPSPDDAELEREVRAGRKFTLAEAIGRAAGDLMKGASPVTRKRQAELEIEELLERHLNDAEGALSVVLGRHALDSETLLKRAYERPREALVDLATSLVGSPARLGRFVRSVDAEWGRIYSRRPQFDDDGSPARPGDPYTLESVREDLTRLLERLADEPAGNG